MDCLISVIIPVYNCKAFLERAVESVIRQGMFNRIEIILIDDGSSDGSEKICDNYAKSFENIFVIHQKNSGVSSARNNGIKNAKGKWISFLDSDDYFFENFFEKMLANEADLICCDYELNLNKNNLNFQKNFIERKDFCEYLFPVMADGTSFYTCWNKLYKKEIIRKNNLAFDTNKKYGEDMMFVYNYIIHIEDFSFVAEPLYFYFQNENSATQNIKNSFEIYKELYLWLCDYFKKINCSEEKIFDKLSENFVKQSVSSLWNVSSEKDVKKIIDDSLFLQLNAQFPIKTFESEYHEKLYSLVENKKYKGIVLFVKKYNLRSALYKIIKK